MSSIQKHFIAFGEFSPDSQEFDDRFMERIINSSPLFSSYRQIPQLGALSSVAVSSPPSGSLVHRTSESSGVVEFQPVNDITASGYTIVPGSLSMYYDAMKGAAADDASYVRLPATGSGELLSMELTTNTGGLDTAGTINTYLRYKLPAGSGSYSITYTVKRDSDDATVITETINGTLGAAGSWVESTDTGTLGAGNASEQFYVEITFNGAAQAASSHAPDGDVSVSGWSGSEASSPLALLLDKTGGADDTKYVQCPQLADGATSTARFSLSDEQATALASSHTLTVRYSGSDTGMDLDIKLYDISTTPDTLVLTTSLTNIATVPTDSDTVLTAPQIASIADYSALEVELTFTGGPGGAQQTAFPIGDIDKGNFAKSTGGTANLWSVLDDNNDSDYIISVDGEGDSCRFQMAPMDDPNNAAGTYRVRGRTQTDEYPTGNGPNVDVTYRLYSGGGPAAWAKTRTASDNWANDDVFFVYGDVDDWSDIEIRITADNNPPKPFDMKIAWLEVSAPGAQTYGRIYEIDMQYPEEIYADFSWFHMDAELTGTFYPGDEQRLYLGTNESLWEGLPPNYALTDVSKTSNASYTPDGASSWMFTTFGEWIIASNYVDPIQVKKPGDTRFSDLLTPAGDLLDIRGRHIATISSQLCVADINPDHETEGKAYTFWTSAAGDPEKFYLADVATQSTFYHLVANVGGITGLVGGEYGLVFKENSIYRARYTGLPTLWEFEEISGSQGTPYPRSIVKVGQDVFFWGSGGIFVITNSGRQLQRIGATKLEKYLFDTVYEPEALRPSPGSDVRENWGAVFGAYDPYSGLIFWSYRVQGDQYGANEGMVIYSTAEDRFTVGDGSDIQLPLNLENNVDPTVLAQLQNWDMAELVGRGNIVTSETHYIRGIWPVQHVSPNMLVKKFNSSTYQPSIFLTNSFSSHSFPGVEQDNEIEIQKLRPVFRSDYGLSGALNMDFLVVRSHTPNYEEYWVESLSYDDRDKHSWVTCSSQNGGPLVGQFFKFAVILHGNQTNVMKEFIGLEVAYDAKGDY